MNLGIQGKLALVTGGTRGIGAEIVAALANEGCTVMATSTKGHDLDGVIHTDYSDLSRLPDRVDILINNAGSTLSVSDPYADIDAYNMVMELNFGLPVRLCNKYIPGMKERGWGRIVNISSCSGLEQRGPVAFTCAKAALTAYTRSMGLLLAKEAQGIVMTAVFPGVVFTKDGHWDAVMRDRPEHAERYLKEQVPCNRFGKPSEIAPLVAFACSQHASFMHGALLSADGGLSKHFWNQVA